MAPTTLKIEERQKRRFDKLQASLRVMTGRRITQDELMDRLLKHAEASPEALVGKAWRPLTAAEMDRVLALPMDWPGELGDVDAVLYGRKGRSRS